MENPVEQVFEEVKHAILSQLRAKIAQLDNKSPEIEEILDKLSKEFSIQAPMLICSETQVTIGQESVSAQEISNGSPRGQIVYYALYTVPMEGDYALFVQLLKRYNQGSNFHHHVGKVFFKEPSPVEIIGNNRVISKIKSRAAARISEIDNLLTQFYEKANKFNNETLVAIINIEQEKENIKKHTEEVLNPYLEV